MKLAKQIRAAQNPTGISPLVRQPQAIPTSAGQYGPWYGNQAATFRWPVTDFAVSPTVEWQQTTSAATYTSASSVLNAT